MSDAKHTPGKWVIEASASITKGAVDYILSASDGKYLGGLSETSDLPDLQTRGWLPTAEGEANARLIAAAPDLLAAAETVLAGLDARIAAASAAGQPVPVFDGIAELYAVVAKAKGGAE